MQITVAQTMSNDPEVHAAGCADIARGLRSRKYQTSYSFDAATRQEVANEFWGDFMEGGGNEVTMDADDAMDNTRFLPCCKLP